MKNEKLKVNNKEYKFNKIEGISLISLIITIVILIILAGIAINFSLGENSLFNKAKYAKEETNKQAASEKINLKITTIQVNKYTEKQEMPTLKELSLAFSIDDEIDYVTEVSQIASTKYEVGENPKSVFTKLKEYPYEFEINSSLQLASIDGVEIKQVAKENTETSTWKKLMMNEKGYIVGTEKVTLPTKYNDLYVKANINGIIYHYNIIYDSLKETIEPFFEGFAINGVSNYSRLEISKTELYISEAYMNGTNCLSTAKIEIWYR